MRIAHVTDGYLPRLGGIELQVRDLALRQVARGDDVEIVTSVADGDRAASSDAGLVVHRPRAVEPRWPEQVVVRGSWERSAQVTLGAYDLVHVHVSIASPLALAAARRCVRAGIPVAVTVHSMLAPASARMLWALAPGDGWQHSAWSGVSSPVARSLTDHAGVDAIVVPNGMDPTWWRGERMPDDPATTVQLVSAMRLTHRKRPVALARAARQAARQLAPHRRLELTIAGSGRLAEALHARRRGGDPLSLSLPGTLDHRALRDLFRRQSLYVAPAKLESFGLAALEARSAGLPLIAWRGSGLADFVDDGRDGLLVSSDRQLRDTIVELANDPDRLSALQARCRRPPTGLGWSVTLDGYDRLYARALDRCRTKPGTITSAHRATAR